MIQDIFKRLSRPLEPQPTGCEPVLSTVSGIQSVLFDVYGTLVISGSGDIGTAGGSDQGKAMSDALAAVGVSHRISGDAGVERFLRVIEATHAELSCDDVRFPEVDILNVWARSVASLVADGLVDDCRLTDARWRQLAVEYEARVNPVWPMPGALRVLRQLAQAGVVLGLISNAQFFTPELFPALFDATPDELDLSVRVYSFEHGKSKPDVALFETAMRQLQDHHDISRPDEVLYIGNDMYNDIYAADISGFKTALFAGDARSLRLREDMAVVRGHTPDLVLTDWAQLPPCLELTA